MAAVSPLDIYLVQVPLNESRDFRPCVIISVLNKDRLLVAPISSAVDLYVRSQHFIIDIDDANFRATGLNRKSYVIGSELRELSRKTLGKRLGKLEGVLAASFLDWLG